MKIDGQEEAQTVLSVEKVPVQNKKVRIGTKKETQFFVKKIEEITEILPAEKHRMNSNLETGVVNVISEGEKGYKKAIYEITYSKENVELSRTLITMEEKEAVDKEIEYGSKNARSVENPNSHELFQVKEKAISELSDLELSLVHKKEYSEIIRQSRQTDAVTAILTKAYQQSAENKKAQERKKRNEEQERQRQALEKGKQEALSQIAKLNLSSEQKADYNQKVTHSTTPQEISQILTAATKQAEENSKRQEDEKKQREEQERQRQALEKAKQEALSQIAKINLSHEQREQYKSAVSQAKSSEEVQKLLNKAKHEEQPYQFDKPITKLPDSYNHSKTLTDPVAPLQAFKEGMNIPLQFSFANSTSKMQVITAEVELYYAHQKIGQTKQKSLKLRSGDSVSIEHDNELQKIFTIPHEWLHNNTGYMVKIMIKDEKGQLLDSKVTALAVEDDWTKFPRYAAVAGSQDYSNSILDIPELNKKYAKEFEQLKNMHINGHFYYDVYKTPTDPLPDNKEIFEQQWNWWTASKVDPNVVKKMVQWSHQAGAKALLYNMISARTNFDSKIPIGDEHLVYNFNDNYFGKKGTPMVNPMLQTENGMLVYQEYYNPASPEWQEFIAKVMKEAMERADFDGWQGDTIGDNLVTTYPNKGSNDASKAFFMSDTYADFANQMKKWIPNKYFTLNAVGGQGLKELAQSQQDIVYTEIWANGDRDDNRTGKGRHHTEYGDLKRLVDQVRQVSGKSLVVAAYMELPGDGNNSKNDEYFQTDAVLLVDATIAAAGGYHMTAVASGNSKHQYGVGVLDAPYYASQNLKVSEELNRKLYQYQQFITGYQNLLRGDGVENDQVLAKVYNKQQKQLSYDDNHDPEKSGIYGNQVWTFTKKGKGFKTIQLINVMGINTDWTNKDGLSVNKTPEQQQDLTLRYPLGKVSKESAEKMAQQVYLTSPDDWLSGEMIQVKATISQDENDGYILLISVPKLTLWNMVYIKE